MQSDVKYAGFRFNELSNAGEIHEEKNGIKTVERWSDATDAASQNYLESAYGLYSPEKHDKALRLLFQERRYHPIIDYLESVPWDGVERCGEFLTRWAKVEDSAYSREVSRLIFAGGIHRLYNPGCKFDDVPILIGAKQGEGKTTLVMWLAIKDEWYGEANTFDGQQAIEQLQGKWICEISEMLALTKTREQEAAKAYLTRQVDVYRKPWDRNVSELPRRCVFIGTTNNPNPLTDKTGNRRYYPIEVHSSARDIRAHEPECRSYILQCWAEAREKYKAGNMPSCADADLFDVYRERQEAAMQDDWRVGSIETYLEDYKAPGDLVCVRELCHKALSWNPEYPKEPGLLESKEISLIMNRMKGWERCPSVRMIKPYGKQRCWVKVEDSAGPVAGPAQQPAERPTVTPLQPLPNWVRKAETAPIWDDDEEYELPL